MIKEDSLEERSLVQVREERTFWGGLEEAPKAVDGIIFGPRTSPEAPCPRCLGDMQAEGTGLGAWLG